MNGRHQQDAADKRSVPSVHRGTWLHDQKLQDTGKLDGCHRALLRFSWDGSVREALRT